MGEAVKRGGKDAMRLRRKNEELKTEDKVEFLLGILRKIVTLADVKTLVHKI